MRQRSWMGWARIAVLGTCLSGSIVCSPALAQVSSREGIALQNQIAELRAAVSQLQSQPSGAAPAPTATGPVPSGDLTAQLLERVSALEDENRQLHGQVDQLTNQVQQQSAQFDKRLSDLSFAQGQGQGQAPAQNASSDAQDADAAPPPKAAAPAVVAGVPELLQAGRSRLVQRQYAAAEEAGEHALAAAKTPQAKLESQFLVAQALAGQRQYRQSAVTYYDAYNRAPRSPRAADALLGVSASMLALGDKRSACEALGKLGQEFPHPAARTAAAARSFRQRAGCR